MNALSESILKCKVAGNVVSLPPMSEGPLHNYSEVRKAFMNAGATYKKNQFIFPSDAQPYIDRLCGGESVNIKKEFQFFGTPASIADDLVRFALLNEDDRVLEPSAGQGAIIKAINRQFPEMKVECFELMPINYGILAKMDNAILIGEDFLKADETEGFDKIIANPPFSKNQDIDHIYKMYDLLKPGGRIVTIASIHWINSSNKKETTFRNWLDEIGATREDIGSGEFAESGTKVATCMLIIDKAS